MTAIIDSETLRAELIKLTSDSSEALREARVKFSKLAPAERERFVVAELANRLAEAMGSDEETRHLKFRLGNAAASLPYFGGQYLVSSALNNDLENGIRWFEKVRNLKTAIINEIMPLRGIQAHQAILLCANVELVPFDSLPPSSQKLLLQTLPDGRTFTPSYSWSPPTSALIAKWSVSPTIHGNDTTETL